MSGPLTPPAIQPGTPQTSPLHHHQLQLQQSKITANLSRRGAGRLAGWLGERESESWSVAVWWGEREGERRLCVTWHTVHSPQTGDIFHYFYIKLNIYIFASCTNFNCDINLHSLLQLYLESERAANTAVYPVDVGIPVI